MWAATRTRWSARAVTTRSADARVEAALLSLAEARAPGTFCPSEAARRLSDDWRPLMDDVRRVAGILVREGRLAALRAGRPVDPEAPGGPIRLGAPR